MVSSSLFISASSVCKSLQCLISALTQGDKGCHLFSLTCSVVSWGRRNTANKYHWHVWGLLAVYVPHWVWPSSRLHVISHLHCSRSRVLCSALSKVDPDFRALLRSKLLRFSFLHTPQRHRLGQVCVLCPSQVWAAQATRRLSSTLSQVSRVS